MDPNKIRDEFSPLLDDELALEDRELVEEELADHADLLRELEGIKKVDALYRAMPRPETPDNLEDTLQKAVRPNVLRLSPSKRRRIGLWAGLAAAAAFVVVVGGAWLMPDETAGISIMQMAQAPEATESAIVAESVQPATEAIAEADFDKVEALRVRAAAPTRELADTLDEGTSAGRRGVGVMEETEGVSAKLKKEVAADAVAGDVKTIGERTFELREGVWCQHEYDGQETETLNRDSDELQQLIKDDKTLAEALDLGAGVIFQTDDTWYQVAPKPEE